MREQKKDNSNKEDHFFFLMKKLAMHNSTSNKYFNVFYFRRIFIFKVVCIVNIKLQKKKLFPIVDEKLAFVTNT